MKRFICIARCAALVLSGAALAGPLPATLKPDWRRVGEVREFGPADLYRYNDGAAGSYLAYGFVRLHTAQYAKADARMVVDVFDMGRPLHAFGIYSTMRALGDTFVAVGNQGVVFEANLDFWHGHYLVHVAPAQAEPVADKAAIELGQAVAARLGPKAEREPWAGVLPKEGLVANSVTYHSRNVLGCRALGSGFTATYIAGESRVQAVVVEHPRAEQAQAALVAVRQFMAKRGKAGPIRVLGERRRFEGRHSYYRRVVFAAQGAKLVGVLRVTDEAAADALLARLLAAER